MKKQDGPLESASATSVELLRLLAMAAYVSGFRASGLGL